MLKCRQCGTNISEGFNFCAICGTPREETQTRESIKLMTQLRSLPDISQIKKGALIDDRYEVISKEVNLMFFINFHVMDKQDHKMKRLCIIPPLLYNHAEAMEFLIHEYTSKLWLNSPNIIQLFSLQESGQFRYVVTEYFKGKSLREVKFAATDHRIPESMVLDIAVQLVSALEYAHNLNILAGLLYPESILINRNGHVKIDQFGMTEAFYNMLGRLINVSGTKSLMYLSPEQMEGKIATIRSDIYVFGILLYELLSGHPPFFTGDVRLQVLSSPVPEIDFVSPDLNQLLLKCLSKDPANRFSQFSEIRKEIEIIKEQLISQQRNEIPEQQIEDEIKQEEEKQTIPMAPDKKSKVKNLALIFTNVSPLYKLGFGALIVIIIALVLLFIKPWQEKLNQVSLDEPSEAKVSNTLDSVKDTYLNEATDYIDQGKFFSAETVLLAGLGDFPGDPQLVELTQKNLVLKHRYLQDGTIAIEILNGAGVKGIARQLSDYLENNKYKVINSENYRENGKINWKVAESFIINHFGFNYQIEKITNLVGIESTVLDTLSTSRSGADISIILGRDYKNLKGFR